MRQDPATQKADPAVVLLFGEGEMLVLRELEAFIARARQDDPECDLTTLWAAPDSGAELAAECGSGSLLASRRIVVIRDADRLNVEDQRQIARALGKLMPGVKVAIVARARGWNSPAVSSELQRAVKVVGHIVQVAAPREWEIDRWIVAEATARGLKLSRALAAELAQLAGSGTDVLSTELDKLATYMGSRQEVAAADVRAVISRSAEADVFALVDAIGRREVGAALELLNAVLGPDPKPGAFPPLLAMIARQLRLIWQARVVGRTRQRSGAGAKAAVEALAPLFPAEHNFFELIGKRARSEAEYLAQARNFRDRELASALLRVHEADCALKGQAEEHLEPRTVLELLVVDLCRGGDGDR